MTILHSSLFILHCFCVVFPANLAKIHRFTAILFLFLIFFKENYPYPPIPPIIPIITAPPIHPIPPIHSLLPILRTFVIVQPSLRRSNNEPSLSFRRGLSDSARNQWGATRTQMGKHEYANGEAREREWGFNASSI